MLDSDLLVRLKTRATDATRRNDAPPAAQGRSVSFGPLTLAPVSLRAALAGRLETVEEKPAPLAAPATPAMFADAERRLGFALPAELVQVLGEIADGGFGPGSGLLPLAEMVDRYVDFTTTPPGPRGQTWPAKLLPLSWNDPGYVCLDCASSKMIFWDEELLAESGSDRQWKKSFRPEADSLAAWFAAWVDTPTPDERAQRMMQDAVHNGLRSTLAYWRAKTPEERRAFGLPETGWEQALFGHLGIDLSKL